MKKAIKENWLAALRSGEYKKGKSYLRKKDNTYCCLGVLCDILDTGWMIEDDSHNYIRTKDNCTVWLSNDIKKNCEISWDEEGVLIALNDNSETFAPVIEYIEQKL
jgi:hypothetical protein